MRTKEKLEYYEQNILPVWSDYINKKINNVPADFVQKLREFYIKIHPAAAFSCWTCSGTIKSALEALSANYERNKPKDETPEQPLLSSGDTVTLSTTPPAKKIIKKNKNK